MNLLQNLCLLLLSAHLLGRLAARCGQPELLGQMLAGVLLGPAVLNWVAANSALNACADLAVLFVVVAAGLEMRLSAITHLFAGRGVLALLPGFLLPAVGGVMLALLFNYPLTAATVIALCVAVTALPVALRILSSFGLQGTPLAQLTIAGALLADVVVLLALSILSPLVRGAHASLALLLGMSTLKLLALLCLVAAGGWLCRHLYQRRTLPARWRATAQTTFSLLLILGLAAASDALGLHFAIGAFLGALTVSEYHHAAGQRDTEAAHPLRPQLESLSNLIFAPLFLACQGTHFTTSSLAQPAFALSLILVAVATKLIGGYWGARIHGLSVHEARGTAIVMNARGVMEMVVASIAFRAGLVDQDLFSTLLIVGIVTTLLTPLLLRRWQKQRDHSVAQPTAR